MQGNVDGINFNLLSCRCALFVAIFCGLLYCIVLSACACVGMCVCAYAAHSIKRIYIYPFNDIFKGFLVQACGDYLECFGGLTGFCF